MQQEDEGNSVGLMHTISQLKDDPAVFKLLLEEAKKRGICVAKQKGLRLNSLSPTNHHYYYNEYIK
jgi:hypothetical protein